MKHKLIQLISVIIIYAFTLQSLAWVEPQDSLGQTKGEVVLTGVRTSPNPLSPSQNCSPLRARAFVERKGKEKVEFENITVRFPGEAFRRRVVCRINFNNTEIPFTYALLSYDSTGQLEKIVLDKKRQARRKDFECHIPVTKNRVLHFVYRNRVPYISIEEDGENWLFSGYELEENKKRYYVTIAGFQDGPRAFESTHHQSMIEFVKGMTEELCASGDEITVDNNDSHSDDYYVPGDEEPSEGNWAGLLKENGQVGEIRWKWPRWHKPDRTDLELLRESGYIDAWTGTAFRRGPSKRHLIKTVCFDYIACTDMELGIHLPDQKEIRWAITESVKEDSRPVVRKKLKGLNFNRSSDPKDPFGPCSYSQWEINTFILNAYVNGYASSKAFGSAILQVKSYADRFKYKPQTAARRPAPRLVDRGVMSSILRAISFEERNLFEIIGGIREPDITLRYKANHGK